MINAIIAATTSISPTAIAPTSGHSFFLLAKDIGTLALSSVAVIISIASFIRAGRNDHRSRLLSKISGTIARMSDLSDQAAGHVEDNLTGKWSPDSATRQSLEESHRAAMKTFRALETKVDELRQQIPCKSPEIFEKFSEFRKITGGDGGPYPVQLKTRIEKKGSPHIESARKTLADWLSYLARLDDGCTCANIKFWKRSK